MLKLAAQLSVPNCCLCHEVIYNIWYTTVYIVYITDFLLDVLYKMENDVDSVLRWEFGPVEIVTDWQPEKTSETSEWADLEQGRAGEGCSDNSEKWDTEF